jgi:uncharacterized repeat protein (TIGR01451 family)/LPXTG-motif cell wall-anchored protein
MLKFDVGDSVSDRGGRRRGRWRTRVLPMLAFVAVIAGILAPTSAASAAGGASVTISSSLSSVAAGANVTLTLSLTCSVTGGCADTTLTFPVNSYTDLTGTVVDDSAKFGALSCPGWTVTRSSSLVTYTYGGGSPAGTLATGTSQCTLVHGTTNNTTPDGQILTLTPTINGSNFTSATGNTVNVSVTATHNVGFRKSVPAQVGSGTTYRYDLRFTCYGAGSIGMASIAISDPLPANFTYTRYLMYYNADNGNGSYKTFPGTVTEPSPANGNTFSYSDPTGTVCTADGHPARDIFIFGTAATDGTPDAAGSTITNTASANWTYLDGTAGSNPASTASATVIDPVPVNFASKTGAGQDIGNRGQYTYPPDGRAYTYTFPGDWNGTGQSAQYALKLSTSGTSANAAFAVQDPMPCLDNPVSPGTAQNPNYASNDPGTICANPAFVPTLITATGFTPSAANAITVTHTDHSTATIPYTVGTGWVIPASPAVAQIDFPPFDEEGSNSAATMMFNVMGYAAPGITSTSLLTNTATATPFPVGSDTPLRPAGTPTGTVMVVALGDLSGTVVEPGIWPRYSGGATCTESVPMTEFGGNGPQPSRIEVAQTPSEAIYLSYLLPEGASLLSGATQTFTFSSRFGGGAGPFTTSPIDATTTADYNGTGRTLLQWVIPAGTITAPGTFTFAGNGWSVDLGPGCAGEYDNDITIGYGAPISGCIDPGPVAPPSNGVNGALNTTNAPDPDNYCGESRNIVVTPINPGFSVDKSVQGNLDAAPVTGGGIGNVSPDGGSATYQVTFTNTGSTNLVNPVMYDLLPAVGDKNTTNLNARGSQFGVTLTGVGPVPAGVIVSYSTAANPCRPEVLASDPGCTNDWTTTQPTLSSVTALKFSYSGIVSVSGGGGTTSFTVPYTVSTPANIAGKTAWNTVGTTANPGVGQDAMTPAESSRTGLAAQSASPLLTKKATPTTVSAVGDVVTYTFTVTNNTQVPLTDVGVDDIQADPAGDLTSGPTCPKTTLAAGESEDCTATYTVTQADIDKGSITDTATAHGTPGSGAALVSSPATATVTATGTPGLTVVKSASPSSVSSEGDTITYSYLVTNSGTVTLASVHPVEGAFTGTGDLSAIDCEDTILAPGISTICTATYQATQADIDAGSISNTATAAATTPTGAAVMAGPSTASVTVAQAPAITVTKSASPSDDLSADSVVTYSFVVTNTGNVTLTDVTVDETDFTGSGTPSDVSCPGTTLDPNTQMTCTATYTITQTDVDNGGFSNSATATGTPPVGDPVTSDASTFTIPQAEAPALTLVKSASTDAVSEVDETITYSFAVTNTGNVTLSNVAVTETAFTGSGSLSGISCPATTLPPGAFTTCTATYDVTQDDLDAGSITNTATASGTSQGGTATSEPSTASVTATAAPGLTVVKSASPTTVATVGQMIAYSFLVTNDGNVTLTDVGIDETAFSGTGSLSAITCLDTTLAPEASTTCSASYAVTQDDLDAGSVTNTADAIGSTPSGSVVTSRDPSTASVAATQAPALTVQKSASRSSVTATGQTVTYSFLVTNTGNVSLAAVHPVEQSFTGSGIVSAISCPGTTLAPNTSMTCTARYRVTAADLRSGHDLVNTATATGTTASDDSVTALASEVTVTVVPDPALATTGVSVIAPAVLGGVLLLGGLVFLIARRRRRDA